MKILIISDSHGHIANLRTAMEIGKKANIEAVIHCGDWDNLESFRTAQKFEVPIYSVLGNADVDSDLEDALRFECKKYNEYVLELELEGQKIAVTHRANIKDEKFYKYKVVFSGHYHSKDEKTVNWTKFIRPGALINGINLAIYETVSGGVEFVEDVEI